jgi:hypothetical protein
LVLFGHGVGEDDRGGGERHVHAESCERSESVCVDVTANN